MPPQRHLVRSTTSPPIRQRLIRTHMPISDGHPILGRIRTKTDRRKHCDTLIGAIVRDLAPKKPELRRHCGHVIVGPVLNLGKKDLSDAGRWHQICPCGVEYLTYPVGRLVLESHPDIPFLVRCRTELTTTPRGSKLGSLPTAFSSGGPRSAIITAGAPSPPSVNYNLASSSTPSLPAASSKGLGSSLDTINGNPDPDGNELNGNVLVTLLIYLRDNESPKRVRAFSDEGLLFTLSSSKISLGKVGLELGAVEIEVFFRDEWTKIHANSLVPVRRGSIIPLRLKGVTEMENWDVDSKFFIT